MNNELVSVTAAAIVRLINERPGSPSTGEIESILAKALPLPDDLVLTTKGAARALADAWALTTVLQEAEFAQSRLPADDGRKRVQFHDYERTAHHRAEFMQQALLSLEPESMDDLLSLVLVTRDAFDSFAAKHSDHATNARAARESDVVERAMHAMVRWLVHNGGASSPLLEAYSTPMWLAPLPVQMTAVLETARELSKLDVG